MTIVNYETAKREFELIEKEANERKNAYINNLPNGDSMFSDFLNAQTEGGSIYELNRVLNKVNALIQRENSDMLEAVIKNVDNSNTEGEVNELMSHDNLMLKLSKFSNDLQVSQPLKNIEKKKTNRNKVKIGIYTVGILGLCFFIAIKILKTSGSSVEIETPKIPLQNLIPSDKTNDSS